MGKSNTEVNPFVFQADVKRVIDGDTIVLEIDKGFQTWTKRPVRLERVDTHEIHGVSHDSDEYQRGMEETSYVTDWLTDAREQFSGRYPLWVETSKTGGFGRYLGTVTRKFDSRELNQDILNRFEGVKYD